jgi:hypothetical protein
MLIGHQSRPYLDGSRSGERKHSIYTHPSYHYHAACSAKTLLLRDAHLRRGELHLFCFLMLLERAASEDSPPTCDLMGLWNRGRMV